MPMLRDVDSVDQYPYLSRLGLNPDDTGRLEVASGAADHPGLFVNAETGESRLLAEDEAIPAGVWIAQREIDTISAGPGVREEPHASGEGWGEQGDQLGGDRTYPEEDGGGMRRVPHGAVAGTSAEPTASDSKSAIETEATIEPPDR